MPRRLGQHFLNRAAILDRIASAACPEHEPLVVEIGPGKGALTQHLLARSDRVIAIETDRGLYDRLAQRFAGAGNLTLIHGDVLETDLAQWGPAVVVGNLPYYITSPILRKALLLGDRLKRAVFLVQREVAERLTAQPGTRQYGFLTVQTLLLATPEMLFAVPPGAFTPPPKVDSAVVRLEPRSAAESWGIDDPDGFLEFVGRCFRHKRKTIRNNLDSLWARDLLAAIPETSLRAEQLPIGEFAKLHRRLSLY